MHQFEDVIALESRIDRIGPPTYEPVVICLGQGLLAPDLVVDGELVELEGRSLPFFEDARMGEGFEEELLVGLAYEPMV